MDKPNAYIGQDEKYIFISYSHSDSEKVYGILNEFKRRGFRFWYDQYIGTSTGWADTIAESLEKCDQFVVFLSKSAIESGNVKDEIAFAKENNKPIFAIKVEPLQLKGGLALQLNRIQFIDFYDKTEDEFYDRLFLELGSDCCDLDVYNATKREKTEALGLNNDHVAALNSINTVKSEIQDEEPKPIKTQATYNVFDQATVAKPIDVASSVGISTNSDNKHSSNLSDTVSGWKQSAFYKAGKEFANGEGKIKDRYIWSKVIIMVLSVIPLLGGLGLVVAGVRVKNKIWLIFGIAYCLILFIAPVDFDGYFYFVPIIHTALICHNYGKRLKDMGK